MRRLLMVTITGNIGIGATTLARRVLESTQSYQDCLSLDAGQDNPYLEDFYRDPARWAFPHQACALLRSLRRYAILHQKLMSESGVFVQDKAVEEHNDVFAACLREEGIIAGRDLETLIGLADCACPRLPCTHALIGLNASPESLFQRICTRARKGEERIDLDHLARLDQHFIKMFDRWTAGPVLRIDAEVRDLRRDPIDDVLAWINAIFSAVPEAA